MKSFYQFLESMNIQVSVNLDKYKKKLWELLEASRDFSIQRREELRNYQIDRQKLERDLKTMNFPETDALLRDIDQGHYEDWGGKIIDFRRSPQFNSNLHFDASYEAIRALWDMEAKLRGTYEKEDDIDQRFEEIVKQTYANMAQIGEEVKQTVTRIPTWNGSAVIIQAHEPDKGNNWWEPEADSCRIKLQHPENKYTVDFMYFKHEGKVVIDDIVDAGDEDIFDSEKIQMDYFALINELKNPNNKGKFISVYTARPVSDREIYTQAETTKEIPGGIFVANNADHVYGLGLDLDGGKERDVWKIRINNKHLISHMDGPIKYWQVMPGKSIPIDRIQLISMAN